MILTEENDKILDSLPDMHQEENITHVLLMDDDITKIAQTVKIARKTIGIIHANIIFAIAVKIVILVLSVFGIANMWMAIFGDVGVLVLCILNAMRLLRRNG